MRIEFYPETDSLYLSLRDDTGVDVVQVNDDFYVDLNSACLVVGIDIQHASSVVDLAEFELHGFKGINVEIHS